jgi:hypothetical protein
MSGFVANGVNQLSGVMLASGDFWPVISLDDLRGELRVDGAVTDTRLKNAALYAIIDTNKQLTRLMGQAARLVDLNNDKINNVPVNEILYFQAVSAGAGAKLTERYRGYDSSAELDKKAEHNMRSADEYRRDQQMAIRDLLGMTHVTVELI